MPFNITSIKTSSNGVWQGDNPLHYAFPLLIVQTTLVIIVSRSLSFLFKPLRQPKVIAEIVGGILLGPSALGRNKSYMHHVFPSWSTPTFESVASIGLLFFLFLVGLGLDLNSIRRSGRRAFTIAAAGILLPFVCGVGLAFVLRKTVNGADQVSLTPFLIFMGVALSLTAIGVLARILAEFKLLNTRLGETAIAAAAFNDVAAWILLALSVALAGDGNHHRHKSPLVSVWVLLSGVAFVIFMMVVIRPAMKWITEKFSPERRAVDEGYICLALVGVMVSGFVTDLIGIHSIFGAFVFGLTIPKGALAERLMERIEDFVSGLLLPLFFASSGLKTDVTTMKGAKAWGLLVLVISTACVGKIGGTFAVAMACSIPVREALTLGVLMNTKGLVELIVLNIGKEKKVLNDEMFTIMVLMALFTTFMTTPIMLTIYKPARSSRTHRKLGDLHSNDEATNEFRVLACVHGPSNVPSIINFIESTRSTNKSSLKVFIMHLVELTERSSSIILAQRVLRDGFPFFSHTHRGEVRDQLIGAFQAYSQLGRVTVQTTTAVSSLSTMHEDICHVADDERVTMIILPFHKQWKRKEIEEEEDNGVHRHQVVEFMGHGWREINQKVLKNAPCSVAVLVDRGYGDRPQTPGPNSGVTQRVCVMFFGGPDDREALEWGKRVAEHPLVKLTIVRFVEKSRLEGDGIMLRSSPSHSNDKSYKFSTARMNHQTEKELDETAMADFQKKWDGMVEYVEKVSSNVVEEVLAIGRAGNYDLIVVGKGRLPSSMVVELVETQAEHAELGPIGEILTSGHGVVSSVLVIQQHDVAMEEDIPMSRLHDNVV